MLRFIARVYAKLQLRFKQEVEAATNDLSASLAMRNGEEKRAKASALRAEADVMDARIKQVAEMEEKGFWLCENGHEATEGEAVVHTGKTKSESCPVCDAPWKFIKRALMTGQEKYESDKERNEVQSMADQRRRDAKEAEEAAVECDGTAKYIRGIAQSNRSVAEKIRAL